MKNYFLFFVFFFTACSSEKTAVRKLYKAQLKSPLSVAQFCGDIYPPITSVKDSVVVLPAKIPDPVYAYIDCDTVIKKSKLVRVKCPTVTVRDTIVRYRKVQVENKAEVHAFQLENKGLLKQNVMLRNQRKILAWSLVLVVVYFCAKWMLRKLL